ncbi:MAG: acyl-CoA dehydrogenase family protein [Gammaproteobacteria bacterium]
MDFEFSTEQQILADGLRRMIDKDYDFATRRLLAASPAGFSEDHWRAFADMGLLGLNAPEDCGGSGGSATDTLVVMQELGRGLAVEPYLSTAVLAVPLIAAHGSASQREAVVSQAIAGQRRAALAVLEPQARYDLADVRTQAVEAGGGFRLSGHKAVVLDGGSAHTLIVSARTGGDDAITLLLVDARAPGVTVRDFPNIDGRRSAEIAFEGVEVGADAVIGAPGRGLALVEEAVDRGIAALCAEAVGAMERVTEMTVEYLRTRRQFGQPIGKFQVLQHRASEMLVAIEQARSLAYAAAAAIDAGDPAERRRAVSAAKVMAGRSGRFVGQQAIQLHGGMGMTDEFAVGWYAKRLLCIDKSFGDVDHHMALFGEAIVATY